MNMRFGSKVNKKIHHLSTKQIIFTTKTKSTPTVVSKFMCIDIQCHKLLIFRPHTTLQHTLLESNLEVNIIFSSQQACVSQLSNFIKLKDFNQFISLLGKGRNRTRHIIPPITNTPSNTYDYEYENENDGSDEENIYEFQPPKSKKIETQNIQQQQQQLLQSPPPDIQNFRNQFYKPVRTRRPSLRGRERVLLGNRRKLFQRTPSNNKPIKLSNREAFRVAESAANEIFSHEHEDDNKDMFDNENTSLIISIPGISSEELAQSFGTATGIENKRPRFGRLPFGSRNVKKNGTRSKIHVNNNHVGYFTNIQKGEDVETFEAYTEEFVEELQNLKSENSKFISINVFQKY